MDYVKDYQKHWHKFIEQIIIHSKHWSKYQKLWASQHVLEQIWINPDYGVPTPLPKDVFWKIAKVYHITEFGPEMPFSKYSCYYTDTTYSINHKKPVPLEVAIGMAELANKAVNRLTPKQQRYFDKLYPKNMSNSTLGLFKIDRMFTWAG